MHWMRSRKGFFRFLASITVTFVVLLSVPRHSTLASTKSMAPTITPIPLVAAESAPNTAIGMTNPPTQSYPAPILESPAPGATIVGEAKTDFTWQWDGDLKEEERFELRIWRHDKSPSTFVIGLERSVLLDTPPYGFGEYLWQVAVVRIDGSDPKDLSKSEVRRFVWTPEAEVICVALSLRSGPGFDYNVIGYLRYGDALDIEGRIESNRWIQVVSEDSTPPLGWVSALPKYVQTNVDLDIIPVKDDEPPLLPATAVPTPDDPEAPEAVVAGGIVPLRSGPGDSYDPILTLPDGTALVVLRRVYNKDNWIKVAVNPGSLERIEGYVNIASGLIRLNVPLGDIPLIYEFGPKLYEPKQGTVYSPEDIVWWFTWERFDLKPDQYYSFRLIPDFGLEAIPCIHTQIQNPGGQTQNINPEVHINPADHNCQRGAYYWTVVIASDLSGGNKSKWREDSEFNHKNYFGIGMPHPNAPHDTEEDRGELPPIL